MKYRKVGVRMCVISIIMIALCIPNQIQIAEAAEGNNEADLIVAEYDNVNDEWNELKEGTDNNVLNVFPTAGKDSAWSIEPGSHGDYSFRITNKLGYKVKCEIRLHATVSEKRKNETPDETYPIKYQLYNRTKDENTNVFGDWINLFDCLQDTKTYSEQIENGDTMEYVLRWMFEQVDSTFKGGKYNLSLKVKAEMQTDKDDNNTPTDPDNPDKPDNPDTPDNPSDDNKKDDNNNSNNNGNHSNNNGNNGNSGNNTNNGSDDSKGNDSSNNNNNQNKDNLNIDNISSKGTGSTETNKKKVNTSDITTPVIYVAFMILTFGLILLVKSRKEN